MTERESVWMDNHGHDLQGMKEEVCSRGVHEDCICREEEDEI